jgi:hypothetical protein
LPVEVEAVAGVDDRDARLGGYVESVSAAVLWELVWVAAGAWWRSGYGSAVGAAEAQRAGVAGLDRVAAFVDEAVVVWAEVD